MAHIYKVIKYRSAPEKLQFRMWVTSLLTTTEVTIKGSTFVTNFFLNDLAVCYDYVGMGPMPWTINSEIYPMWARSSCNSVATSTNWMFNLLISMTFLTLTKELTKEGKMNFWPVGEADSNQAFSDDPFPGMYGTLGVKFFHTFIISGWNIIWIVIYCNSV